VHLATCYTIDLVRTHPTEEPNMSANINVTLGPPRGPSERSTRPGGPSTVVSITGVDGDELTMRMFPDGVVEITRPANVHIGPLASAVAALEDRHRELLGT